MHTIACCGRALDIIDGAAAVCPACGRQWTVDAVAPGSSTTLQHAAIVAAFAALDVTSPRLQRAAAAQILGCSVPSWAVLSHAEAGRLLLALNDQTAGRAAREVMHAIRGSRRRQLEICAGCGGRLARCDCGGQTCPGWTHTGGRTGGHWCRRSNTLAAPVQTGQVTG